MLNLEGSFKSILCVTVLCLLESLSRGLRLCSGGSMPVSMRDKSYLRGCGDFPCKRDNVLPCFPASSGVLVSPFVQGFGFGFQLRLFGVSVLGFSFGCLGFWFWLSALAV